jgi:hypothetical protein
LNSKKRLAQVIVDALSEPAGSGAILNRHRFTEREWRLALRWLDYSGLALFFWDFALKCGVTGSIPPSIRRDLAQSLEDHRHRVERMLHEQDQINAALTSEGVAYAVLKGFALVPDYCADPNLRTSYDYDYLVAPDATMRAEAALRRLGYMRSVVEPHATAYIDAAHAPWSPQHRRDLYAARFPRTIELHTSLWTTEPLKIPLHLPPDPLARRRWHELNGGGFFALSEEDELIFQALHTFQHMLQNWCRLCSFLEIACFLKRRASDLEFWARFATLVSAIDEQAPRAERETAAMGRSTGPRAARGQLSSIFGIVFTLAARLFQSPLSAPALDLISLTPSMTHWLETYGIECALQNFGSNKLSLLLHHQFVTDPADWRKVRRRLLFPLHAPNQASKPERRSFLALVTAKLRQLIYVARRLAHHTGAAAEYAWICFRQTGEHRER